MVKLAAAASTKMKATRTTGPRSRNLYRLYERGTAARASPGAPCPARPRPRWPPASAGQVEASDIRRARNARGLPAGGQPQRRRMAVAAQTDGRGVLAGGHVDDVARPAHRAHPALLRHTEHVPRTAVANVHSGKEGLSDRKCRSRRA